MRKPNRISAAEVRAVLDNARVALDRLDVIPLISLTDRDLVDLCRLVASLTARIRWAERHTEGETGC